MRLLAQAAALIGFLLIGTTRANAAPVVSPSERAGEITDHYGEGGFSGEFDVSVRTTLSASRIEPGEPISGTFGYTHVATHDVSGDCEAGPPYHNSGSYETWWLEKVVPGGTVYSDGSQSTDSLEAAAFWEEDSHGECLEGSSQIRQTYVVEETFSIPGTETAGLAPGCYQTQMRSGQWPLSGETESGTIAVFGLGTAIETCLTGSMPDRDGDSFPDYLDDCPDIWAAPGTSENGCPPGPGDPLPGNVSRGHVGVSCGEAKFDWYDITGSPTFIHKGEKACFFLFSNRATKEILKQARRGAVTFSHEIGKVVLQGLRIYGDDIARFGVRKGVERYFTNYTKRLEDIAYHVIKRAVPRAVNAMAGISSLTSLGNVVGLQAIPLTALWVIDAIKEKGACVGVALDVDRGKLKVDWQLVYSENSVIDPIGDGALWRAEALDRLELDYAADELAPMQLGLRCAGPGYAEKWRNGAHVWKADIAKAY